MRGLLTRAAFTPTDQGIDNLYDGFGGLISTTTAMGPVPRTVTHKYDSDGRRVETGLPGAAAAWFRRDGLGRITDGYQGNLSDTSFQMIAFAYHAYGSLYYFSRRYGDGTAFGYDAAARLISIDDGPGAAGSVFSSLSYTPSSQLWQETKNNDSYAWNGAYPASRSYSVNGLNQYTDIVESGAPAGSLGHDANGNIISDGSTTYAYDAENRLVSATGAKNATLVYDPLGRLAQVSSGGVVTQFVYDGDDDPLYWYEGGDLSQARFPHTDRKGSIVAIAGAGAQINRYDAWGVPAAGNAGRFQYTGQAWIPELGLYYYKARMYSPGLGRFMQTDPVGYKDQINLYAYVGNDPLNKTDPTGQDRVVCTFNVNKGTAVGGCKFTPDDSSHTRVTYNINQASTNYAGTRVDHYSYTTDYKGSISKESLLSRIFLQVGAQIRSSIDQSISNLLGHKIELLSGSSMSSTAAAAVTALPPASSPIWQGYTAYRGGIKTDGENYYTYDRRHGEIEVFDKRGNHLGTKNAVTGEWEKDAVAGRKLDL